MNIKIKDLNIIVKFKRILALYIIKSINTLSNHQYLYYVKMLKAY